MKTSLEVLFSLPILVILVVFLNPTHLLMPDSLNLMLIIGLIVAFLAFAALLWQERADDERDTSHMQKAGRLSYMVGVATLVAGVVVQAFQHNLDPWLIYALSLMVLSKVLSRIFYRLQN